MKRITPNALWKFLVTIQLIKLGFAGMEREYSSFRPPFKGPGGFESRWILQRSLIRAFCATFTKLE